MNSVRIGIIDSGVNADHPHVGGVAGGVWIRESGDSEDYVDRLGHGTAVAAAIREKAPSAEIYAVKVFDRSLSTTGEILLRALDWCLESGMQFINLSLGTLNEKYTESFLDRIRRAEGAGIRIVSAYERKGRMTLPGCLPGVVGVVLAPECPRAEIVKTTRNGHLVCGASGFPRDIPGVPRERNLQGISFAVANVTGFLAAGHNL
ncbi:MAG: S8 family serine peptidase [Bryobacteraceae bacterium]